MDEKTVLRVARVARLNLTENEIKEFSFDLDKIIKSFEKIKEANTSGLEPSFQPNPLENVLRDDKIEKSLDRKDALKNVKDIEEGFIKGPRVM